MCGYCTQHCTHNEFKMNAFRESNTPEPSAQDRAYAAIKQAIIELHFKAGEPLRAQDIAKKLGSAGRQSAKHLAGSNRRAWCRTTMAGVTSSEP